MRRLPFLGRPAHLLAMGVLCLVPQLCACSDASEEVAAGEDQLVDTQTLPTLDPALVAGDAFNPILGASPARRGEKECLEKVTPRFKTTKAPIGTARIAQTQQQIFQSLGLSVEGLPVNVPQLKLAGASAAVQLAIENKVSEGSIAIVYQVTGELDSEAVVSTSGARFDPKAIASCGWGYAYQVHHRLSAIVVVNIESTTRSNAVLVGCDKGEAGADPECKNGTGLQAGDLKVGASLARTLKQGAFNISVRSAFDPILDLPAPPLGDMASLSSTPENADATLASLNKALQWVGDAQTKMATRMNQIPTEAGARPPAVGVEFRFFDGVDATTRERIEGVRRGYRKLAADVSTTRERIARWEAFEGAVLAQEGHMYNVPHAPAKKLEELVAKKDGLIGKTPAEETGSLRDRLRDVDLVFSSCLRQVRGDDGADNAAVIGNSPCNTAPPPEDTKFEEQNGIRRIAPASAKWRGYDEWNDDANCPAGQRLPTKAEAALLSPWSYATGQDGNKGVWVRREHFWEQGTFIRNGKVEQTTLFTNPSFLALCFPNKPTLFPVEPTQ